MSQAKASGLPPPCPRCMVMTAREYVDQNDALRYQLPSTSTPQESAVTLSKSFEPTLVSTPSSTQASPRSSNNASICAGLVKLTEFSVLHSTASPSVATR